MDDSPFISIILLNYNGMSYIRQCIESVLKSDYGNFELIVLDNNSTDKSIDIVESEFDHDIRVKIIRCDKNLGFAAGNNFASQHAKGKYLALLNIDTIVDRNWLTELARVMEDDNTIGVVQPKLLSLTDKSKYDSAGDFIDYLGNNFRLGGEWEEKDNGQYDTIHDIFSARGAALFTRKELVENIGLFDEDFFMTFEDVDYCWRTRLYGKRIVFAPKSVVYHKGRGISMKDPFVASRIVMLGFKNIKTSMIKNYDLGNMIKYAILPTIAEIITFFFLVEPFFTQTENKSARIMGRLKGYFWVLASMKKLASKRRHIQTRIRSVPDSQVMKYMLQTSPLDFLNFALNTRRFGYPKARMLYVRGGLSHYDETLNHT